MMYRRKQRKSKENLVVDINFSDHMRPINSKIQLTFEQDFHKELPLSSMIREIEERLILDMSRDITEDGVTIQQGPLGNVMSVAPIERNFNGSLRDSKGNFFRIVPKADVIKIKAVMNLTPTIYVQKGYIDLSSAVESMKNEIADYIIYLTWNDINYSEFERHLSPKIRELEVHLGRIMVKYDEKSGMPMKVYTKPKRRMTLKRT